MSFKPLRAADRACRPGCAACCTAPSISSAIPGMPHGKPAGIPCVQLDANRTCRLFGQASRPLVCSSLAPSAEMCGDSAEHAIGWLAALETATAPASNAVHSRIHVQPPQAASPARRRFLIAAAGTAVSGMFAYLGMRPETARAASIFPFIPSHYTFSRNQVQEAVARRFPFHRNMAQVFDMTLADPVVSMRPDTDRVGVGVTAHLESPFLQKPVNGTLLFSTGLAYDDPTRSVILKDPTVEQVELGDLGLGGDYRQEIDTAAALATTRLLANYPIHTFKPEELSFAGVAYQPGIITILSNGIRVEIAERQAATTPNP